MLQRYTKIITSKQQANSVVARWMPFIHSERCDQDTWLKALSWN